MPTYLESEQSKHGGRPVELFKYEGTYLNFFYTSGGKAVTFEGDEYISLAGLQRSAVKQTTQNDDNAEVTIEMPVSSEIVSIYGFQISPPRLSLTIYRGHGEAGPFVQYWSGEVENIQVAKGTATIRVPSRLSAALNADLPNVYFQGPCNHTLGDPRCGIDLAVWSETTSISAIDGRTVTVASVGAYDGQLLGGDALLPSGERRMIMAQTGNVLTLNYPFAGAELSDVIILAVGCDLAWKGDCKNKFNNTEKFGGFPLTPLKNVFANGLEPGKDVADEACIPDIYTGIYWSIIIRSEADHGKMPSMNVFGPLENRDIQPNPGGRRIRQFTQSFAGMSSFLNDIYELNTPDPYDQLNGQPLEIGYALGNGHFRRDFYYPFIPSGNWKLQIQYNVTGSMSPRPSTLHFSVAGSTTSGSIGRLWPYYYYVTT